jgi:MerR family transcriptional regulator, light-induced transcriptional regulator
MVVEDPLLKTRQLADAIGVSVSTIKRWVDAGELKASRTVGKHRLISLSEAVRFALQQGLSIEGLEALGVAPEGILSTIDDSVRDRLADALRQGDGFAAKSLVRAVLASDLGAAALADELIRPVMEQIGHGWMVGDLDVFEEHQASHIVAAALTEQLGRVSRSRNGSTPLALGATPEGDFYQLALLLGELLMRELGWDVRNLGVNLPLESMAHALGHYRPRLVFISVSHLADEGRFLESYLSFFETATAAGTAVVVGGRALGPELRTRLRYASYGERMMHLSEFARQIGPGKVTAS